MSYRCALLAFCTTLVVANAAVEADRVQELPAWSGALPSAWYSGYLSFGRKHLHYVLVEAETDQSTAPLIAWFNGGPGCSSLDALFYEHGPLLINGAGDTLVRNPWTWAKAANVLYIEAPAGVGFSYSEDQEDYQNVGDEVTASDNLQALKAFFASYPEYKSNDFYLTGESYAGVYVPTLSYKIFQDSSVDWNMKGFIVGNGVMDWEMMVNAGIPFLHGHGAISERLMARIDAACPDKNYYASNSSECTNLAFQGLNQAPYPPFNLYDYYRDCWRPNAEVSGKSFPKLSLNFSVHSELLNALIEAPRPPHPALQLGESGSLDGGFSPPCVDSTGGAKYLSMPEVRSALHIHPSCPAWNICTRAISYSRGWDYKAQNLYREMMGTYKILVFHGDTDMACNYLQGTWAMDATGAAVDPDMDWVPWFVDDSHGQQAAGFVTKYDVDGGMFFVTVKGAGHMVPQWKPVEALTMISRFLSDSDMRVGTKDERPLETIITM